MGELALNLDEWESLPDSFQSILYSAASDAIEWIMSKNTYEDAARLHEWIEEYGASEVYLPEEDVAELSRLAAELLDEYAVEYGGDFAELVEILKDYMRLRGMM